MRVVGLTMARWHWVLRPRALVTAAVVLTVAVGGLTLWDATRGPAGAASTRTVTYCVEGGQPLAMTLFTPGTAGGSDPVVLQVHGGGWQHGGRLLSLSASGAATDLVGAGFVVASIDYRLAPENPWPDQIIDAKCAVRYLRAHAIDLGIDPNQIAALGDSAGGQLVSLLGTTGSSTLWDEGPYANESSAVDAVVDEFGPADLSATGWPVDSVAMIRRAFGAAPGTTSPILAQASPNTHVAAGDPPFLIVQGTDDQVVPVSQSEHFAAQLRAEQVPVDLVLVDGGRHGLETPGEDPSPPAIASLITAYLVQTFHG
jgi:acetyl esterase/lipase